MRETWAAQGLTTIVWKSANNSWRPSAITSERIPSNRDNPDPSVFFSNRRCTASGRRAVARTPSLLIRATDERYQDDWHREMLAPEQRDMPP